MARKIKTARIYRTDLGTFDNNNDQDKGYLYKKREYDAADNMLWEIQYLRNGKKETITDYYFDEKNKLTEKKIFYPQDNTEEKTLFTYDEAGNLVKESLYYDGELYISQKNIYNDKNKQTAIEMYDEADTLTGRDAFEYNENGDITKQTHYNETGEADWQIESFYNDKNLCVKEIHRNLEENTTETILFTYNEAGKNTRSENYDADGNLIGYVEVTLDADNRPVKYVSETMGFSLAKVINQITYNEEGKIKENEYYDVLKGYLASRESYEYDRDGNLKTEEIFDLRSESDKKSHYRLLYNYDYFEEEETEVKS
jgi:hypothetical protein